MELKKLDPKEPNIQYYEEYEIPYYDPPYQNSYERAKWNSNGFDQIGNSKNRSK